MHIKNWPFLNKGGGLLEIFIQKPIWKPVRGVYFVLKLKVAPKCNIRMVKIVPTLHFAHNGIS